MTRLTGRGAKDLREAYSAVYASSEEVVQEVIVEETEQLDEVIRPTTGQQTAPKAAPAPQTRPQVAGGGMGGRRGSGSSPSVRGTSPTTPRVAPQQNLKGLSIGPGGFNIGGRPVQPGMSPIFQRPGQPAPARPARPAAPAKPAAAAPKAAPVAATPAKPAAPVKTTMDGSAAGKPAATPATPQRTFNPLMQRTFGYQTGNAPSQIAAASAGKPIPSGTALGSAANPEVRKKLNLPQKNLNQDLDLFDIIKGHLLDEGYAETEEAALAIMANMGESWKQSILEEIKD